MWYKPTATGRYGLAKADGPPRTRLDDIGEQLGVELAAIRSELGSDTDIAVVIATRRSVAGSVALVATRTGVLVHPLDGTAPDDLPPDRARWRTVRVSPVTTTPTQGGEPSTRCEVHIGDDHYVMIGHGKEERAAIEAFHDEIVRRGTPWHYPG
jgi:hypothetical protein